MLTALVVSGLACPAHAGQTVTLGARDFAPASPSAPFREAFGSARRRAADTTAAWASATDDLPAWGPALIFPLLGSGVSPDVVSGLAAPLAAHGTAPQLIWRTLGLYAAKSRLPFLDTPTLLAAVRRNLETINRAANNIDAFANARELQDWGPVALHAWVAYLNLLFRDYWDLGNPGAEPWNAAGLTIVGDLLARARLPTGAGFRGEMQSDELRLWPNALMLYALIKAYENEELVRYETAAIETVTAIEPLRDGDGAYFSSAAKSDKDPRANVYLAVALLLLANDTGDVTYQQQALGILRWLAGTPARDAAFATHLGYLILLLDTLAMPSTENVLGRRPMRSDAAASAPPLAELRPADFRYRTMFDGVLDTLSNRLPHLHGDYAYDYGDSPGYAAEILLAAHQSEPAVQVLRRQQALLSWPRARNLDEISFGVDAFFAALEHRDAFPSEDAEGALRRSLFFSGVVARADRYYLDRVDQLTGGGGYGYGPTVIGAQIALAQLRFAHAFPQQRIGWIIDPLSVGRALVDTATTLVWDDARHCYRDRPGSDEVWLLPNAIMILASVQAHALTGDRSYLDRAAAVVAGIEPLWEAQRGAYVASSTQTGPEGYLSLSTNSYAALALHRLAAATGTQKYRARAQAILDFFQRELFADGVVYHHVYRGRRTAGDIWCPGCNWRVLSIVREVAKSPP